MVLFHSGMGVQAVLSMSSLGPQTNRNGGI